MKDTPDLLQMQQQNATPVSGEHLEVMGKRAASMWAEGRCNDLSDSVVEVIKQAGLAPEQVRRVIEFANINAFLGEFKKEGEHHKLVDFGDEQLADPSKILQDLNDGGSPAPPVDGSGIGMYFQPPEEVKEASITDEQWESVFGSTEVEEYPMAEPDAEYYQMCEKLAGTIDHLTSELSGLEVAYRDATDVLREHVKQACMTGVSMGDTVRAWATSTDDPLLVKCASEAVTPVLLQSEIFRNYDAVAESITKMSSARVVNPKHPLVTSFGDYCEVLNKLAYVREQRDELSERLGFVKYQFEKLAGAGGVAGSTLRALGKAGKHTGALGKAIGGETVGGAAKYLPHAVAGGAVLAGGNELKNQVEDSPTANLALSGVPGTKQERNRRQIRRAKKMQGAQGNPLARAGVQYMGGGY